MRQPRHSLRFAAALSSWQEVAVSAAAPDSGLAIVCAFFGRRCVCVITVCVRATAHTYINSFRTAYRFSLATAINLYTHY